MSNDVLYVNMLGEFSLTYKGHSIDDSENRSKKLWMLLEYLLVFKDREIAQNEIIDLLWPEEDVANPANTLKVLVYRTRQALDQLGLDGKQLIINRRGTYSWHSNNIEVRADIDLFEETYKKAENETDPKQRLTHLLQALDIYKGDFLPKTSLEVWAVPICTYYHGLYITMVKDAIQILNEAQQYDEIIRICRKAVIIDPYDEVLHIQLIEALVNSGRYHEALAHYESSTKMFYSQFGITPSKEFMAIYKKAIRLTNAVETDLTLIKTRLQEEDEIRGAFYCEYEIFKVIYQLEARSQMRSGQTIFLGLLTVTDPNGEQMKQKTLSSAMEKLMNSILHSLRFGDVAARFSVSQYILMFPCVTMENGEMIVARILRRFRHDNPRSTALIRWAIQPIDPKSL